VRLQKVNQEELLNRRWRPALMAFFLRRVRNPEEAEDLTQEVFIRMLANVQAGSQPDVYIFQIAQNLVRDRARKAAVRERYKRAIAGEADREVDWLDPYDIAAGREQLATLVAALADLPERTRTIFILFRIENMSQDAIGSAYGISKSAVKKQVAKAMAQLVKTMRDSR